MDIVIDVALAIAIAAFISAPTKFIVDAIRIFARVHGWPVLMIAFLVAEVLAVVTLAAAGLPFDTVHIAQAFFGGVTAFISAVALTELQKRAEQA